MHYKVTCGTGGGGTGCCGCCCCGGGGGGICCCGGGGGCCCGWGGGPLGMGCGAGGHGGLIGGGCWGGPVSGGDGSLLSLLGGGGPPYKSVPCTVFTWYVINSGYKRYSWFLSAKFKICMLRTNKWDKTSISYKHSV